MPEAQNVSKEPDKYASPEAAAWADHVAHAPKPHTSSEQSVERRPPAHSGSAPESSPHPIQDDLQRVRAALGPRTRGNNLSYPERVRNTTIEALDRIQEQLDAAQRERDAWADSHAEKDKELWALQEQLQTTHDILRGFLHDADNNDRPSEGLRDMARAALYPASEPKAAS